MKFFLPALILFSSLLPLRAAPAAAPAPRPDDAPCEIVDSVPALFPKTMLQAGVSRGSVHVMLHVSAGGELVDTLITAYSRKAFADEARRVIQKWKFVPARAKGVAVDAILIFNFQFETAQVLVVEKYGQDAAPPPTERMLDFEYHWTGLETLDRMPVPLNVVEPTYPREWGNRGIAGSVTVDFFIDEKGVARFPIAAPNAHEMLASIAVAAVQQWRFAPPKSKGKPVLVRARQVFTFEPEPAASPPPTEG